MRIGLFTDSYPPYINGVSTSVDTLKFALEKKGHTVYVVTVGQDATTYDYDEKNHILTVPGIPIGIYDYRASSIYPLKVVNRIKSWDLDIIHSHTELCMGIFARLFAKQHHIPLVHTYHTMYKDYTYYISRNLKLFDLGCKKAVEYLSKFYCDQTADAFIVPTVKTYHLFRNEYHYNKDIFIVPTGIDAKRFYLENVNLEKVEKLKEKLGYKRGDFILLFVGRLAQEKNIEFLLRVMKKIKEKNKKIKLLIVGDGPDKKSYEDLSKEYHIDDIVTFYGKVPLSKMPQFYHVSNCFITASVTETQGLTVIEALASSIPVLCIEDEAFETMIVDSLNGRIFKDEASCVARIEELVSDKKEYKSLKLQTRNSIKKYSLDAFADSVLEVYETAMDNFKNKRDFPTRVHNTVQKIIGKKGEKDEDHTKS